MRSARRWNRVDSKRGSNTINSRAAHRGGTFRLGILRNSDERVTDITPFADLRAGRPCLRAGRGQLARGHLNLVGPAVTLAMSQDGSLWDVHFSGNFAQANPGCVARLNLLPGFVRDLSAHSGWLDTPIDPRHQRSLHALRRTVLCD